VESGVARSTLAAATPHQESAFHTKDTKIAKNTKGAERPFLVNLATLVSFLFSPSGLAAAERLCLRQYER